MASGKTGTPNIFYEKNGYALSFTDYRIQLNGKWLPYINTAPDVINKRKMYNYCYFSTITVMYDAEVIGLIQIPNLRKNNDYASLIIIKLASSIVYIIRPIYLYIIAKKQYAVVPTDGKHKLLTQKSTAFGQHIAWVIHNNTDIAVLTVFGKLSLVTVYSVYYMIVSQIQNIVSSFTGNMEAVFGELYAKKEIEKLNCVFNYYETLLFLIAVPLFSATIVLIVPFVRLYMVGLADINYIEPLFAVILSIACLATALRSPYGAMIIAAGEFKRTRVAAYGEAIINIVSSIILVFNFGLIGVAIATVMAILFRWIFYSVFLSKNVIKRSIWTGIKKCLINIIIVFVNTILGNMVVNSTSIHSYFSWVWNGVLVSIISFAVSIVASVIFYRSDVDAILLRIFRRRR